MLQKVSDPGFSHFVAPLPIINDRSLRGKGKADRSVPSMVQQSVRVCGRRYGLCLYGFQYR